MEIAIPNSDQAEAINKCTNSQTETLIVEVCDTANTAPQPGFGLDICPKVAN